MAKKMPHLTELGFAVKESLVELPHAMCDEDEEWNCSRCNHGIEIENAQLPVCPLCGMPKVKRGGGMVGVSYRYTYGCGTEIGVCRRLLPGMPPSITKIAIGQGCVNTNNDDLI